MWPKPTTCSLLLRHDALGADDTSHLIILASSAMMPGHNRLDDGAPVVKCTQIQAELQAMSAWHGPAFEVGNNFGNAEVDTVVSQHPSGASSL